MYDKSDSHLQFTLIYDEPRYCRNRFLLLRWNSSSTGSTVHATF